MIDATNISRLFKPADTTIKELVVQCKAVIKDNNKILLRTISYRQGIVKDDDDKIFNSMPELFEYYDKFMGDKLVEVKGVPVKIIGDVSNGSGKGFMATSDMFSGLDIMPIRGIENTLVLDYADINYIRAIPLSYILEGKISEAGGAYVVSSSEALSEICRYPIPLFDKILWGESKI